MAEKQELGPNQRKWVEALRSGRYEQGPSYLCKEGNYCCLGVGCKAFEVKARFIEGGGFFLFGEQETSGFAPEELVQALALYSDMGDCADGQLPLTAQNDAGRSFAEIADLLESDPSNWFSEAR